MSMGDRRPVPPDQQCRATTRGQLDRGAYWSPPHRCGNYATADGYCRLHRPAAPPPAGPDDAPEGSEQMP